MATYYVAKSGSGGSDSNPGTIGSPFLTINHGIAALAGADTLYVRTGTYVENVTSGVPSGSSNSARTRIAAYPGETVTLKPSGGPYAVIFLGSESYVEWDGIHIDGENLSGSNVGDNFRVEAWASGSPHHIRVKNCTMWGTLQNTGNVNSQPQMVQFIASVSGRQGGNECINCTLLRGGGNQDFAHAVYLSSTSNLVEGCNISGFLGAGIQVYNGYGLGPDDNILRNNVIHDNTFNSGWRSWGIIVAGARNQVYNNVIYGITNTSGASSGIDIFNGDPAIYNNTVYGCAAKGIYIEGQSGSVIRNNILYGNGTDYFPNGYSPTQDHNLIGSNPLFANAGAANFRLSSESSPAHDAGTFLASVLTDILGVARPQHGAYDIGAYEFESDGALGDGAGGSGGVITSDTFTDTAGTNLLSHSGETGAIWVAQDAAATELVISDANRLRVNVVGSSTVYYASGLPVSVQYDVAVDFRVFTLISGNYYQLYGRAATAVSTGYIAQYNVTGAQWELYLSVNGSLTLLGTYAQTLTGGQTYRVKLEVRTAYKRVLIDGVQRIVTADDTIEAAGRPGLGAFATTTADTNSTGIHYDSFSANDWMYWPVRPRSSGM